MSIKVNLKAIIEELELYDEGSRSFFNTKTGEVITFSSEEIEMADRDFDFDMLPDWERDMVQAAIDLEENFEDYIELPDKYEIDEYGMMVDFALSLEDKDISNTLYSSLQGKGAFGRFKDKLEKYKLWDRWNTFHEEKHREVALEWCEDNDLEFMDE